MTRVLVCLSLLAAACGHNHTATPDASNPCGVFGATCAGAADCCSPTRNPAGTCDGNPTMCSMPGASCSAGTDCCSYSCVGNVCQNKCTADNSSCGANGECCSGTCGSNGMCTPLVCPGGGKSDGNPCMA